MKIKDILLNLLSGIVTQLTPTIAGSVRALIFMLIGGLGGPVALPMVLPAADKPLAIASLPLLPKVAEVKTVSISQLDPTLQKQVQALLDELRTAREKAAAEAAVKEAADKAARDKLAADLKKKLDSLPKKIPVKAECNTSWVFGGCPEKK